MQHIQHADPAAFVLVIAALAVASSLILLLLAARTRRRTIAEARAAAFRESSAGAGPPPPAAECKHRSASPARFAFGCASCLGLGCLAIFGLAFATAVVAFVGTRVAIEEGPVRSIEIHRGDRVVLWTPEGVETWEDEYPVHVVLECDPGTGEEDLRLWLEARTEGRSELLSAGDVGGDGGASDLRRFVFGVQVSEHELDQLDRELKNAFGIDGGDGSLRIELRRGFEAGTVRVVDPGTASPEGDGDGPVDVSVDVDPEWDEGDWQDLDSDER